VSNVTGQHLDLLRTFLNLLPPPAAADPAGPPLFQIDDTFSVPVRCFFLLRGGGACCRVASPAAGRSDAA
jgi:hypothetical protein